MPRAALLGAVVCVAAAFVYQIFGHGVYSLPMTLCFLPPLGYGLWRALRGYAGKGPAPLWADRLLGAGAATLAVGMFLWGVMEIAGAESAYPGWFLLTGGGSALAGLLACGRPPARPQGPTPL